jgi:hypothetical protein
MPTDKINRISIRFGGLAIGPAKGRTSWLSPPYADYR